MHEIEAGIAKDPVVRPIVVCVSVLTDVAGRVSKATVSRRHVAEVPNPGEKCDLVEAAVPIDVFQRDEVEDVSARDLRESWGRTRNAWHPCILAVVADDVAVVVETP